MTTIELISVYDMARLSVHILYDILNKRSTEDDKHINISHRKLPPWEEHVAFFDSRPYECWYLIYDVFNVNPACAGTCYVTKRNEIGIVLFKDARGKGIGTAAVKKLMETKPLPAVPGVRGGGYLANINPNNQASIRMFEKLGFRHIQNTYHWRRIYGKAQQKTDDG